MEEICSSEMLATINMTAWHHNPKEHNVEYLTYYKMGTCEGEIKCTAKVVTQQMTNILESFPACNQCLLWKVSSSFMQGF
jgi:hypothetical protein